MKTSGYKIITIIILVAIISSCSDQLNVAPKLSVDATTAVKTSKDVKAVLIGAYSNLGSVNLYGGAFTVQADLLASAADINFFGTFQGLTQIANKSIPINNTFVSGMWLDGYATINTANTVLANLSLVDSLDRDQVEGEAKFIRGSLFFELVKFFARAYSDGDPTANPGIPIILKPTLTLADAEITPARNTVAEVYAQILSDLKDAKALLPEPESVTYYFATTGAASGQLSRVYLSQLDYGNALTEANTIIQSGDYRLTNTYADEFPYTGRAVRIFNTTEDIFAQQVSEQNGTNDENTFYANADVGGRGDIEMSIDYLNTYEEGDDRLNLFEDDGSGSYFYTNKFDNQFGNLKLIRLAEMYLTRAECNFRLSSSVGANPEDDVNLIRARAFLDPLDGVDLDQILTERHHELAFEGQWLADYRRTRTPIELVPPLSPLDPSLIYPIPQRELQVNPNLVQNAGY